MSHIAIGLAIALATMGAPATTPAPAAHATPTAAAPETAPDTRAEAAKPKKICTKERPMGSNMPKRVCRDTEASEEQASRVRDVMRDAQRNRYSVPTGADL